MNLIFNSCVSFNEVINFLSRISKVYPFNFFFSGVMDENVAALHQVKHEDDNNNNDNDNEKEPSDGMHNY